MPIYQNPAKVFNYRIEVEGVVMALVQDLKIPTLGIEKVEHGAAGPIPNIQTPGKPTVGDIELQKLVPADPDNADFSAYAWYASALAGQPALFARTGFIRQLGGVAGQEVVRSWMFTDAWVSNIDTSNFQSTASENLIETLTITPHLFMPANSPDFKTIWENQ